MPSARKNPSKNLVLAASHGQAKVCDDAYSDRLRCDHPMGADPRWLADALIHEAESRGRGKIMTLVNERMIVPMQKSGFRVAAYMPGFYQGRDSCGVLTLNVDSTRLQLANPKEVGKVHSILKNVESAPQGHAEHFAEGISLRMSERDAPELAKLLGKTFKDYPTPSHEPAYLLGQYEAGVPFRFVRSEGEVVACASADLVSEALAAELTDCATLPEYRGRGYMKQLLLGLMNDLREKQYPTAFTMARARVPGINILFKQLGFRFCGQLSRSCRIGDGLEDMNLWIRKL